MRDRQADIERISERLADLYELRDHYRRHARTLGRDLLATVAAVGVDLVDEIVSNSRSSGWFRDRATVPPSSTISVKSTMKLEAPTGSEATGAFLVENVLQEPIVAKLQWTDFVGDGLTVRPQLRFDPPELQLAAGQEAVVGVAVALDESLAPGVVYRGELFVAELPGTRLQVEILRQAQAGEPADAPASQ